ncbi:hypothetical protein PUN28_012840 [Cardiocondyla obscurior]|uniref:Secreted protein n=1 Tax=Cardiocondyla obscurior TaxID=286306 RepID=A0AAW2F802_9HYME
MRCMLLAFDSSTGCAIAPRDLALLITVPQRLRYRRFLVEVLRFGTCNSFCLYVRDIRYLRIYRRHIDCSCCYALQNICQHRTFRRYMRVAHQNLFEQ